MLSRGERGGADADSSLCALGVSGEGRRGSRWLVLPLRRSDCIAKRLREPHLRGPGQKTAWKGNAVSEPCQDAPSPPPPAPARVSPARTPAPHPGLLPDFLLSGCPTLQLRG